jgi:hypothetical protein
VLGGELYPWRCRARVRESRSRAERLVAFNSEETKALPFLIAVPPAPSHDSEAVCSKYSLRCLTMDTSVAGPAIHGSYPVQFRLICLCHPIGDARSSFLAPFCRRSSLAGRHYSRRSRISKLKRCFLTHSHLPRPRGALSPEQAIKVSVHVSCRLDATGAAYGFGASASFSPLAVPRKSKRLSLVVGN